ncbi:hypothetical protein CK203_104586 [Vitis vinifera]|uniref:Uncharacterized protein n=1 Tax=Vitis vinifera TaxID=29760 RepID=A0A438D3I8_VITVI|nr:hypothetical protein CK203_104586 [Vitis vinifera]
MEIIAPAPTAPSTVLTPEATSSAPPTTPGTLPVTLTATQSVLAQQMAIVRAHQDQLIATQTQHTAILRQIQQHLGILLPPEHDMPGPSEPTDPSQDAPPASRL